MPAALPTPPTRVRAALLAAPAWVVVPHVLPDVDALASAAALCLVLRATGRQAGVHSPELPEIHRWVLPAGVLLRGDPDPHWARVAVDTARLDRLQGSGAVAVAIDHHEDNPGFGQAHWVAVAPACTCLIAALAESLGVSVDRPLATALYAGLVGDTEGFRVNLASDVFAWAERFVCAGADAEGVAEGFHQRSPGFWEYLARVEAAGFMLPGPVPFRVVPIPRDLADHCQLLPYENALLPSHLAPPRGGVLAILQEGRDSVRFRLRSRGVDLLPLAHALGGGGHPQAAGVMLRDTSLADAEARLRLAWQDPIAQASARQTEA